MSGPRVPGIFLEYRPAGRTKPYLVIVDTRIAGTRVFGSQSYLTEAEAEVRYAAVAVEIARQRAEADQQAALRKALKAPLPTAPRGTLLFETLALRWLEKHVSEMCEAATYRNYKGLLDRYLFPIMRTWPVDDQTMDPTRILQVLREELYDKGVGLPTRIACQRCLSACFKWIKGNVPGRLLTTNPAADLALSLRRKTEKQVRLKPPANPMTRVQAEAFIAWQDDHYPEVADLFVWLIDEGSRVSEASALKWTHLDLDHGKAHIQEAFSYAQRQQELADGVEDGAGEKDTKTHRTDQHIDLSRRVVTRMRARKTANLEAWMARGRYGREPQHCFLNRDGKPRRADKKLYRAFHAGCAALQLKGESGKPFTIHCLRDTFATLSLLSGKPVGYVAMMLGHSDIKTTLKHYVKWIRLVEKNLLDEAADGDER